MSDIAPRRKLVHRLPRINGRRGAFQLLFGIVYACLALAMLGRWPSSLAWMGGYFHHTILTVIWGGPAIAALIGAFLPRPKDAFSFVLLTVAPVLSGLLFLISVFIMPESASPYGTIVYLALGGTVMVVSGMTGDRDRDEREVSVWSPG